MILHIFTLDPLDFVPNNDSSWYFEKKAQDILPGLVRIFDAKPQITIEIG